MIIKSGKVTAFGILAAITASATAGAATITFQQGVTPSATYDQAGTHIRNDGSGGANASLNFGTAQSTVVGRTSTNGGVLRTVTSWDLSAIPAGSTITGVSIAYTKLQDTGSTNATFTLSLHQLTNPFVEAEATWVKRDATTDWTTPGGDFSTLLASASANPNNANPFSFEGTGALDPLVQATQAAVDGGGPLSYLMKASSTVESTNTRVVFIINADDATTSAARPLLTVDYTPIPEPGALAALSVAGCALLRRR